MNITKEQADKVIATIEFLQEVLVTLLKQAPGQQITLTGFKNAGDGKEALSIMRGLEDAEPQNRCITELLAFAKDHPGTYVFPGWDGNRVLKYLATSPQAAQTEAALREVARLGQLIQPEEFHTEAQEREAFEAFMLTKYPAHLCHWVGDQYSEMFTRLVFVGWKAGRAGRKG